MPQADHLDLSVLPPELRQEVLDFYHFLIARHGKSKAIHQKRDISRHDFSDLCGKLTWKGDAVKMQRVLRDEW